MLFLRNWIYFLKNIININKYEINMFRFLRHELISNKRQEISFPPQYKRIRLCLTCLFDALNSSPHVCNLISIECECDAGVNGTIPWDIFTGNYSLIRCSVSCLAKQRNQQADLTVRKVEVIHCSSVRSLMELL